MYDAIFSKRPHTPTPIRRTTPPLPLIAQPGCPCLASVCCAVSLVCLRTEIGCASNVDCPTQRACINQHCVNPCKHTDLCQADQECQVDNHNPVCVKGMGLELLSACQFTYNNIQIPSPPPLKCASARTTPTARNRSRVTDVSA